MTTLEAARRAIREGPASAWGEAWAHAAALLLRQELETGVDRALERHLGAVAAPMAAKLGALRGLEVRGAIEVAATWGWLSEVIHGGDPPAEGLGEAADAIERWLAREP